MEAVKEKQVLYETFSKGYFVPLIMILISEKWEMQEKIELDSFRKEIQEIQGPTETLEFYSRFSICMNLSTENGMYSHKPWHYEGIYYPESYNKEQAEYIKLSYLNLAQKELQNQ